MNVVRQSKKKPIDFDRFTYHVVVIHLMNEKGFYNLIWNKWHRFVSFPILKHPKQHYGLYLTGQFNVYVESLRESIIGNLIFFFGIIPHSPED